MNDQRWFIVLSPDGAARSVSMHVAKAFSRTIADRCKTFDTLTYRQAFQRLLDQRDDDLIADLLNQSLAISCFDFQATHLLVNALSPVTLFTLNLLRKYGIKTVHWFFEDFHRAPYWLDVVRGYDHFCAIQRGPIPDACRTAGAAYHFLPTACCFAEPAANKGNRIFDIAFIGLMSGYRISVLEALAAKGFRLAIAGSGWNTCQGSLKAMVIHDKWTSDEDSRALLSQAKIGINLSVDEPREPEHVHTSPRVYDVLAAGCILLSENVPLLKESLAGANYFTFDSSDSACSTTASILNAYDSYSAVIEKNRVLVFEKHTYQNRVEELMKITGKE